jgi:hypothetical protein
MSDGQCCRCGAGAFTPAVPLCYDHITQDEILAWAKIIHRDVVDKLRGFDRVQHIKGLVAAHAAAVTALDAALEGTGPLEAAAAAALAAERTAEDHAREAAAYARQCEDEAARATRDGAGAQRKTETLTTSRAAADVAAAEVAAHQAAAGAREHADTALAVHQDRVRALEDAERAARTAMENPPERVPISVQTAFVGHPVMVLAQPDLDDMATGGVRAQVLVAANLSGLAGQLRAEGRDEGREKAEQDARHRPQVLSSPDGTRTGLIASPLPGRFAPGRR